jgi:hypothetical protein
VLLEGMRMRQSTSANHLLDVEPRIRVSPTRAFKPFSPNLRLNLALLVAINVPVATPYANLPQCLLACPSAVLEPSLPQHSGTAVHVVPFPSFQVNSLVGELRDLATTWCLGYAPAVHRSLHHTSSTHAAVCSVPGAHFASYLVLINR